MADDFGSVTVTPPAAPVRDARRLKRVVIELNKVIPEVDAIEAVAAVEADEGAGIEAVAAVEAVAAIPSVPAGTRIDAIEVQYTQYSSTDEKTHANPDGVLSQDGANRYKGANVVALKAALFKAGAKAEIEIRLAEDNIDL